MPGMPSTLPLGITPYRSSGHICPSPAPTGTGQVPSEVQASLYTPGSERTVASLRTALVGKGGSVSGLSASGLCRTGIPTYSRGKRHGARADPLDLSLARGLENQHRKAGTLGVRLLGQVWGWAGGTGRGSATAARRGSEREPPFLVLCLQKGKGEAECPAGTAGPHPPEEDEVQIGAPGAAKVTASQHRKRLSC